MIETLITSSVLIIGVCLLRILLKGKTAPRTFIRCLGNRSAAPCAALVCSTVWLAGPHEKLAQRDECCGGDSGTCGDRHCFGAVGE